MKKSIYTNTKYCLSFNGDTVFLTIEVEIIKLSEDSYKANVVRAQLDPTEEGFPLFLVAQLPGAALAAVLATLREKLLEELNPSLFSLFHVGDLQPDATDITA